MEYFCQSTAFKVRLTKYSFWQDKKCKNTKSAFSIDHIIWKNTVICYWSNANVWNYFLRFGSMIQLFISNYVLIVNVIWLSARAKNVFADFQRNRSMLIQSQNFGANNAKQDTRIWWHLDFYFFEMEMNNESDVKW